MENLLLEEALTSEGCPIRRDEPTLCDQQSCLYTVTFGSRTAHVSTSARGRLSSDLGRVEEQGDLQDLLQARRSLHRHGKRLSQLLEPVEGDRVQHVHASEVPWPPSAKEPSRTEAKESLVECEGAGESRLGGKLEIMAATDFPEVTCSFSAGGGERSELLGRIYPSKTNKLYCIDCPEFSSSASSISLQVEAPSSASLELNLGVGLRLRGHDLLTSLKVEAAEEVTENMEDMEAFQRSLSLQAAHHGTLHALPTGLCYCAETSIEFLAYGLSGHEEINVYANGLTITCASDLRLGHGAQSRRLFRFVLSPVTCELRSVILRLRLDDCVKTMVQGMVIDKMYGFRICGHEALPGVQYVDANSYILNPYDWSSDSPEQHALVGGHWTWDGFYYLLAYKRSKRRLSAQRAQRRPLLLGGSSDLKERQRETYLDLYRENTLDSDTLPL